MNVSMGTTRIEIDVKYLQESKWGMNYNATYCVQQCYTALFDCSITPAAAALLKKFV